MQRQKKKKTSGIVGTTWSSVCRDSSTNVGTIQGAKMTGKRIDDDEKPPRAQNTQHDKT